MKPAHYVVMGVSGSGKSAVAARLGVHLDLAAVDADDLHPETNITKMAACVPLTDADRVPWLESLVRWMDAAGSSVVACSALKRSYRDILRRAQGMWCLFILLRRAHSLRAEWKRVSGISCPRSCWILN